MTEQHPRCHALTKAGSQCKKSAQTGSPYCYVHRNYKGANVPEAGSDVAERDQTSRLVDHADFQSLLAELNELTRELNKLVPDYEPPAYSPQGMFALLKSNLDRLAPESIKDLQSSLEGTSLDDFRDVETWKGMWFTLNYLVRLEAGERAGHLTQRLSGLPGVSTLADLKEMLADTPPEEFLKLDTWKGIWFIANYELQNQAQNIKARFRAKESEA